jgi:hypothetical protein
MKRFQRGPTAADEKDPEDIGVLSAFPDQTPTARSRE